MVNAQQWLDEKYPIDGVCKRDNDSENKNKRRGEITALDISKGKVGGHWYTKEGNKILVGSLKLEGFTNLRKLICLGHELTSLDVSNCSNLERLDCQNNQLNNLNVKNLSNLKEINCDFNKSLKEVDMSSCPKLEKMGNEFIRNDTGSKLVKGSLVTHAKENDIRNILIVGMTGSGKSALANTLADTNDFGESDSSTSETKNFRKSKVFEWQGKKYRVIDSIGFGDSSPRQTEEEFLLKIGEIVYFAKEGINQILFTLCERIGSRQIEIFNRFKDLITESEINKFTIIVRTNFYSFRNLKECKEDSFLLRKNFLNTNEKIGEIINNCNGIIHVDNPSIFSYDEDYEEMELFISKKKREMSREKVLNHLVENCQEVYKLSGWDSLYFVVEKFQKNNNSTNQKRVKNEVIKEVKNFLEINSLSFTQVAEIEYTKNRIN